MLHGSRYILVYKQCWVCARCVLQTSFSSHLLTPELASFGSQKRPAELLAVVRVKANADSLSSAQTSMMLLRRCRSTSVSASSTRGTSSSGTPCCRRSGKRQRRPTTRLPATSSASPRAGRTSLVRTWLDSWCFTLESFRQRVCGNFCVASVLALHACVRARNLMELPPRQASFFAKQPGRPAHAVLLCHASMCRRCAQGRRRRRCP